MAMVKISANQNERNKIGEENGCLNKTSFNQNKLPDLKQYL